MKALSLFVISRKHKNISSHYPFNVKSTGEITLVPHLYSENNIKVTSHTSRVRT